LKKVIKLFKNANKNSISNKEHNTKHGKTTPADRYEKKNGLYQMNCVDCPLKYIEQTDQTFYTIYKEHIQTVRNNNGDSGYSNHILNTGHAYSENHKNRENI
jgi:hypothetical protein